VLTALTFVEHTLGWERPTVWMGAIGPGPGAGFWPWTLLHLAAFVVALVTLLRFAWIAEYARLPWWDGEAAHGVARAVAVAVAGVVLVGLGISVIAAAGLVGFPLRVTEYEGVPFNSGVAMLMCVAGIVLLRRAGRVPDALAR